VCGLWFNNTWGNGNVEIVGSGKWGCEMCKWERISLMEEKLKNGLILIEDIKLGKGKVEILDSGMRDCERCKWERICLIDEKLKNSLIEIENIKLRNG
jgi:hypothetical protein